MVQSSHKTGISKIRMCAELNWKKQDIRSILYVFIQQPPTVQNVRQCIWTHFNDFRGRLIWRGYTFAQVNIPVFGHVQEEYVAKASVAEVEKLPWRRIKLVKIGFYEGAIFHEALVPIARKVTSPDDVINSVNRHARWRHASGARDTE